MSCYIRHATLRHATPHYDTLCVSKLGWAAYYPRSHSHAKLRCQTARVPTKLLSHFHTRSTRMLRYAGLRAALRCGTLHYKMPRHPRQPKAHLVQSTTYCVTTALATPCRAHPTNHQGLPAIFLQIRQIIDPHLNDLDCSGHTHP